jgi:hypothetical protein
VCGLVRRDAEKDLLDELLHQRRRRARATAQRRHVALVTRVRIRRSGLGGMRCEERDDAHDTTPGWSWTSVWLGLLGGAQEQVGRKQNTSFVF